MALSLLTEQVETAAKVEGTYGSAEALTAAEAAMNWFDSKIESQGAINERRGQSSFSRLPGTVGLSWNKFTGKTELYGGGSTPVPAWADFLKASGMALSTATFTPQTGNTAATSLTVGVYTDGVKQTMAGTMFNFKMAGETGMPVILDFEGYGTYIVPTDTALLAPTYPTVGPPVFMASTFTIASTAYNLSKFELSPNNRVVMRKAGNQSTAAPFGCLGAIIVDRKWTLKATVEASLLATKDWYALYQAGTTFAFNSVFGGTSNNIATIAGPAAQMSKPPAVIDVDGVRCHEIECNLVRSAAAGDDEISIVFS